MGNCKPIAQLRARTGIALREVSILLALLLVCPIVAAADLNRELESRGRRIGVVDNSGPCAEADAVIASSQLRDVSVQFIPALDQLIAWREFEFRGANCLRMDWPQTLSLGESAAAGLRSYVDDMSHSGANRALPMLQPARIEPAGERSQPFDWSPPADVLLGSDSPSLPLCPRTPAPVEMVAVQLPDTISPLLLRIRPHRCQPGSRPLAGSGALIAPNLALTAAHVVLTAGGMVCDRYRVIPGGRRYSDPPSAPFGLAFVSRAFLSERGGWTASAKAAPPLDTEYSTRTAHDFAYLLLDAPVQLPKTTRWPRLRFMRESLPPGLRILRGGYSSGAPAGRSAPGVAVNLLGSTACARGEEKYNRFAVWMAHGASGGPIWHWPDSKAPLELLSLAVRMEAHGQHQFETLGPRFDVDDYQRLLDVLRKNRAILPRG